MSTWMLRNPLKILMYPTIQPNQLDWPLHCYRQVLQPEKYFYYLIGFHWDWNGNWSYSPTHDDPTFAIHVKLPDGMNQPIAHLPSTKALVTLGVATCPSGMPWKYCSRQRSKQNNGPTPQWLKTSPMSYQLCCLMQVLTQSWIWPVLYSCLIWGSRRIHAQTVLYPLPARWGHLF